MDRFPGMAGKQLPPNLMAASNSSPEGGGMSFLDYMGMRNPGVAQAIQKFMPQAQQLNAQMPQFQAGGGMGAAPPMGVGGGGFSRFMPGNPQGGGDNLDALRAAIAQLRGGGGEQDPSYNAGRAAARMMSNRGIPG